MARDVRFGSLADIVRRERHESRLATLSGPSGRGRRHPATATAALWRQRRDVRRCVHRSQPRKSRIFSDLHLASERPEAGALVEAESGRVIEGAGVRPKTPDRTRPGTFNGAIHQPSSCWPADQRSGQGRRRPVRTHPSHGNRARVAPRRRCRQSACKPPHRRGR